MNNLQRILFWVYVAIFFAALICFLIPDANAAETFYCQGQSFECRGFRQGAAEINGAVGHAVFYECFTEACARKTRAWRVVFEPKGWAELHRDPAPLAMSASGIEYGESIATLGVTDAVGRYVTFYINEDAGFSGAQIHSVTLHEQMHILGFEHHCGRTVMAERLSDATYGLSDQDIKDLREKFHD